MSTYTGDTKDPQRYNHACLTGKEINESVNTLLEESLDNCSRVGLNPFCTLNPALDVSNFIQNFLLFIYLLYVILF